MTKKRERLLLKSQRAFVLRTIQIQGRPLAALLCFWLACSSPLLAEGIEKFEEPTSNREKIGLQRSNDFFSEDVPGEQLISIQLLGSVSRSGVYRVPRNTDLIRLLSLAGGTRAEANLRKIGIRRRNTQNEKVMQVDLVEMTENPKIPPVVLLAGDTVLVYARMPLVDRDTLNVITVLTSILSLLASAVVLSKNL
jgi:hypothetical protein